MSQSDETVAEEAYSRTSDDKQGVCSDFSMKIDVDDTQTRQSKAMQSDIPRHRQSLSGYCEELNNGSKDDQNVTDKSRFSGCKKQFSKFAFSHLGLIVLLLCYSFLGAAIFKKIERVHEKQMLANLKKMRDKIITEALTLSCSNASMMNESRENLTNMIFRHEKEVVEAYKHGIRTGPDTILWDYWGSLFFCTTVFTTIGKFQAYSINIPHFALEINSMTLTL